MNKLVIFSAALLTTIPCTNKMCKGKVFGSVLMPSVTKNTSYGAHQILLRESLSSENLRVLTEISSGNVL